MTTRINACIDQCEVEGQGATLDDALNAIALDCDESAAEHERQARALRTAAAGFRARRESCAGAARSSAPDGEWPDYHDAGPGA